MFGDHEGLSPKADDIVLHGATWWAIGIEACNTTIDVRCLPVEEAPLAKLQKLFLIASESVLVFVLGIRHQF